MQEEIIDPVRYPCLQKNLLFAGLPESTLAATLTLLSATGASYQKGECLHHAGHALTRFGVVLSGALQVYTDDMEGNRVMMANVTPGESFGESLCFLARQTEHLSIVTAGGVTVLWLSLDPFRAGVKQDAFAASVFSRFTAMLAARTLDMNERIQILSKHSLREKLLTFFAAWQRRTGQNTFTIPFGRAELAAYLGADRTALSRELSAMQKAGIIEFYRSSFKINR